MILGTAAYISPEQAKGKRVDRRTDIWALGCCIYEMLTGDAVFREETVSGTIAAVLKTEPDWGRLPKATPSRLRRVLERCLQKDPARRMRDVGDAKIEIEESLDELSQTPSTGEGRPTTPTKPLLASLAAALLLLALWSATRESISPEQRIWRLAFPLPSGHALDVGGPTGSVAISPDARWVAYLARPNNVQSPISATARASTTLFVRRTDRPSAESILGAEGTLFAFFSPDSQWLGYFVSGKLMKVSLSGSSPGPPVTIEEVGAAAVDRGASWGPDGWIVYNRGFSTGLSRISENGGVAEILTTPARERGEKTHRFPHVLPGGGAVLFTLGSGEILSYDDASIAVLDLETREYRVILEGGTDARYVSTGHLVYARDGALWAAPFDLSKLQVTGTVSKVVGGVVTSPPQGPADYDVAKNGTLVFASGIPRVGHDRVVWVDRTGRLESLIETRGYYPRATISPDGRFLALYVEAANSTIWLHDIARGTTSRLTFNFDANGPIWTPDSTRVTFRSSRSGPINLFWQAATEGSSAERLTISDFPQRAGSWSPDGRVLAFQEIRPETAGDIWTLDIEAGAAPTPFLESRFNESAPKFSPGRAVDSLSFR